MKFRKFGQKDKGTFKYWVWHLIAFNTVAWKCKHWRPRHLFHDMEKPLLLLLWEDYRRVRLWHKHHNRHHLMYGIDHGFENVNYIDMMIDWESSHLTKADSKGSAREELEDQLNGRAFYLSSAQKEYVRERATEALEELGL